MIPRLPRSYGSRSFCSVILTVNSLELILPGRTLKGQHSPRSNSESVQIAAVDIQSSSGKCCAQQSAKCQCSEDGAAHPLTIDLRALCGLCTSFKYWSMSLAVAASRYQAKLLRLQPPACRFLWSGLQPCVPDTGVHLQNGPG